MRKAIVEDGKVINLIVHEDGELLLPQGQLLVDPGEQEVCMGDSYDETTGRFRAHNPLPASAVPDLLSLSGETSTDTLVEQAPPVPAMASNPPLEELSPFSAQAARPEQRQTSTFLLCKREIHNRRQPAEVLMDTLDTLLLAGRLSHSEYSLLGEMLDETL